MVLMLCSCNNQVQFKEHVIIKQKVEAFKFLSKYHHQLHIMIGEEEGDGAESFDQFNKAISRNDNFELTPIRNALYRINPFKENSESVKRLDYLVDYYQSGLSMQIEAIMRGYGYLESFSMEDALSIYDSITNED